MVRGVALLLLTALAAAEPDPPGFRRPALKPGTPADIRKAVEAGTAERLEEAQSLWRSIQFEDGVVARLKAAKPVPKGKGTKFAPEISADTIAGRLKDATEELAGYRAKYARLCADVGHVPAESVPPAAVGRWLVAPPADLRVMSFNVRYGSAKDGDDHWDKRKGWLADTVTAFDPDLLGTQETEAAQRDFLAGKLPGHTAFAAGRDDGKDAGESAAVYYRTARFERLAGGHFWLSATPEAVGSKGWDAALPRVATWVKLTDRHAPAARPILYLNTHLDHVGKQARLESARLIRAKLAELGAGCRLVTTGDFNAGEGSEPYRALFGDGSPLADTFRAAHPASGKGEGTFNGFKADATGGDRIDWIGCSPAWTVREAGIDHTTRDGRTPSDHFPVTAVLRPVAGPKPLRVLSYNIHHGEGTDGKVDLSRLAAVIIAADPDLVALQEVDDKTRRTGGVDQTAELARLTGLHGRFGKQLDYEGGGYGQAVLTREPPTEATVHRLPGVPDRERRMAFAVRVPAGGREVLFVTAHLHHQNAAFREQQAAELTRLFAGADRPVILAGDFNATPEAKAVTLLADKWASATADPGLVTYPAGKPIKQIDYVFTRTADRFRAADARVVAEPVASDHRPVLVTLHPPAD